LTYIIENTECRIITFNSLKQNEGIGTLLLEKLKQNVKDKDISRLLLETTNDNLNALKFYQKRGFKIIAIYPDIIEQVRKIKPQIPLIGNQDIPLRDIFELEMKLK